MPMRIEYRGVSRMMTEWSVVTGIPYKEIRRRWTKGYPAHVILDPEWVEPPSPRVCKARKDYRGGRTLGTMSPEPFIISHGGECHTIREWSRITGLSYDTIRGRILYGWEPSDAVSIDRLCQGHGGSPCYHIVCDGVSHTAKEWASILDLDLSTIYRKKKKLPAPG